MGKQAVVSRLLKEKPFEPDEKVKVQIMYKAEGEVTIEMTHAEFEERFPEEAVLDEEIEMESLEGYVSQDDVLNGTQGFIVTDVHEYRPKAEKTE
jgi:hypothetical protein